MKLKEKRMRSYVIRGNELIAKGNTKDAYNLVGEGLTYYSNNILRSVSPYAAADAGLIVLAMRHIADQIEANNAGAKDLASCLDMYVVKPQLTETTKIRKPNMN